MITNLQTQGAKFNILLLLRPTDKKWNFIRMDGNTERQTWKI